MQILGKNVIIGNKKLCVEYTSKINEGFNDCFVGNNEYKGKDFEKDLIFIRDKNGYLIELKDLTSFPNLSLICFGAATRWKTSPSTAGDYYIGDIKPYFSSKANQEHLFDVRTLIKILSIDKKIQEEHITSPIL